MDRAVPNELAATERRQRWTHWRPSSTALRGGDVRYRLVGTVEGRAVEFPLDRDVAVLGSGRKCDLRLMHPTVSRAHAELRPTEDGIEVRDMGSKNGTFVEGARVTRRLVADGEVVRFGLVSLRLDGLEDEDGEAGVVLEQLESPAERAVGLLPEQTTSGVNPFVEFSRDTLPMTLCVLASGAGPGRVAQTAGSGLATALSMIVKELRISCEHAGEQGILYQATFPSRSHREPVERTLSRGGVAVFASFWSEQQARTFEPLLDAAASIVALAQEGPRVVEAPPREPRPALPAPATVNPQVQAIYDEAAQVARTDVGALIAGESGTGKELLARFIHDVSRRADGPYVALNCAALPRDLLEAELFGIERGVATGVERRAGKFELADGGTLFLDEIGDMPLETQSIILRVLQEGEVTRIGAARASRVSVRVLAATNQNVDALLAEGRFREDLFYRVAAWRVELPPLRQRREDIANLAVHFLAEEAARNGTTVRGISRGAVERLLRFDWPGNIRQLRNEMTRAATFVPDGGLLDTSRLSPDVLAGPREARDTRLADRLRIYERREITRVLLQVRGDTAAAARILGLPRSTLYRRIRVLDIHL